MGEGQCHGQGLSARIEGGREDKDKVTIDFGP